MPRRNKPAATSLLPDDFQAQICAAYTAYHRSVGDYHQAKRGLESAHAAGRIDDTRRELVRLAAKVPGLPPLPLYVTRGQQGDRDGWAAWSYLMDRWREELEARLTADDERPGIEEVPAGFRLWGGDIEPLTGKPLAVLKALLDARDNRLSADDIRRKVWPGDAITYPEQAVKGTVSKLRKALCQALQRRSVKVPGDSVPSTGRGADLTYQLKLPALPPQ
jgi:hypothetical protein